MKKEHNSIDQLFQKNLADYEMDAPMHLLDGILKEKNKKPGIWWWNKGLMVGLVLLIAAGSLLFGYISLNKKSEQQVLATIATSPVSTPEMLSSSVTTTPDVKAEIDRVQNQNQNQNQQSAQLKPVFTNTVDENETKTNTIKEQKTIPTFKSTIKNEVKEQAVVTDIDESNNTLIKTVANQTEQNIPEVLAVKGSEIKNITLIEELNFTTPALFSLAPPQSLLQKTECSDFAKAYAGVYAEVNISYDMAQRQFYTNDEVYDDYVAAREASEQQNYAYSMGFHLTALMKSGFLVKTGVDYHQIGEKLIYQDGFKTIFIIEEIKDAEGIIIARDTISNTVPNILTGNNKYHLVQVPFLIGFEANYQNYSMGVYGGPILNVLFRQEVAFLSKDDLAVTDFSNDHTVFRKNLGIGWRIGLGLGYRINNQHQITLQPYFQINPKSFTQDKYPVKQKYFVSGIRFGWKTKIW